MSAASRIRCAGTWLAGAGSIAAVSYAAYACVTWVRYGRPPKPEDSDPLLDRFLPEYEVREYHRIRVAAPAPVVYSAACDMDLGDSRIIRAIFRTRELVLGAERAKLDVPRGLIAQTQALGWGVLAEVPGREIVMGAVTQPWLPKTVFRAIPPDEFAGFHESGFVKIAWTLRADPIAGGESIHITETRVTTTDAFARAKFRRYWATFSPGIRLIRRIGISLVKAEAERRAQNNEIGGAGVSSVSGPNRLR